jgi:hypothetical protein
MTSVPGQPKTNNLPAIVLIILYIALWIMMAVTWMYDDAGYSVGMPWPAFLVMLASPLVAGFTVGWSKASLGSGVKAGMIAGPLLGAANIVGNLLWGGVLWIQGKIPAEQPFTFWQGVAEVLEFLLLFAIIGLVLGAIGGLAGTAIGNRMRSRESH